jgi:hypothetical protein
MRFGWTRWLGILAVTALAVGPAMAQDTTQEEKPRHERGHDGEGRGHDGEGREHDPEKRIEKLREALSLTDAQVEQVREIFAGQGERMRTLHESGDREGMRALHADMHERLVAVLDESQRARLEELRQRHEGGHGRHGGEKRDGEDRGHGEDHDHGEGHEEDDA